eukprot:1843561-Prymnesium_polylepis.1
MNYDLHIFGLSSDRALQYPSRPVAGRARRVYIGYRARSLVPIARAFVRTSQLLSRHGRSLSSPRVDTPRLLCT